MDRGYVKGHAGQIHYFTQGKGEAVLLLHQTARTGGIYNRVADVLSPHYRVVAMDFPGFGGSDPFPGSFEVSDLVQSVLDVMDGLGIEKVRVSGHHTGAVVSGELASSHPDRVVAWAPTGYPYRTAEEREQSLKGVPSLKGGPSITPSMYLGGHRNPVSLQMESDGTHLFRIWQQATSCLYHARGAPGPVVMFPPENLPKEDLLFVNDMIIDYLRAFDYQLPTLLAVRRYDANARLPLIKAPSLIIQSTGPFEPTFCQRSEMVQRLVPGSRVASIKNGDIHVIYTRGEELGKLLLDFFRNPRKSR